MVGLPKLIHKHIKKISIPISIIIASDTYYIHEACIALCLHFSRELI
uniref:Uncharacterized protein n=1 Tax=Arundo donax TaxID=35708 RepID=A0A0A9B7I5_ARUDO